MQLPDALPRLPAAVIDLDAFDANLASLRAHSRGKRVRLATKSLRVPALLDRALRSGAPFSGLMCYSAEEVRFLSARGFDDFLLAYPTVQSSDLDALREALALGKTVRAMTDCSAHLEVLSAYARRERCEFPVLIDIDASLRLAGGAIHLGVRRSPVRSVDAILRLIEEIRRAPGLRFAGLMAYEAQVAGLTDRNPFARWKNPFARWIRRRSAKRVAEFRAQIAEACRSRGISLEVFNGGGTGSLRTSAGEPALSEVTAGSGLYSPHLFDYYSDFRFRPACFFALQVVRSSDEGWVTCQGGGYVASGAAGTDRLPRPVHPKGARLLMTEGAGEVQTPVRLPRGVRVPVGTPLYFRHAKAGELMEHFAEVYLVSGGRVVGREKTYRGFGQSFF